MNNMTLYLRNFLIFFFSICIFACSRLEKPLDGTGTAKISPEKVVAGDTVSLALTYTAGKGGIVPGGTISLWWPFFSNNAVRNFFQTNSPDNVNYLNVATSSDCWLEVSLPGGRLWGDHYYEKIRILVLNAQLKEGETVTFFMGGVPGKGKGMTIQRFEQKELPLQISTDANDDVLQQFLPAPVLLTVMPDKASYFEIAGQSIVQKGKEFALLIRAEDKYGSIDEKFEGTIQFITSIPIKNLPKNYTFSKENEGVHRFENLICEEHGLLQVSVKSVNGNLSSPIHPILITEEKPSYTIYWGEMHAHTFGGGPGGGSDGSGSMEDFYPYTRDKAGVDFAAITDHLEYWQGRGNQQITWAKKQELARRFNEPGRFVTFLAGEFSHDGRDIPGVINDGHRNIYYKSDEETLILPKGLNRMQELLDMNKEKEALVIPHHTGYSNNTMGSLLACHDSRIQRLIEIYSAHGNSECPGCLRPVWRRESQVDWHGYVQNALAKGWRVGIIAGSDTHEGHPGNTAPVGSNMRYQGGLAGVYASELTRDAIWEGLWNRRCYGTSGDRILLQFTINNHNMGSEIEINDLPTIEVTAVGTTTIQRVEILRFSDGDSIPFPVVYRKQPEDNYCQFTWTDSNPVKECLYYIRVVQEDEEMAWSSPIWVKRIK